MAEWDSPIDCDTAEIIASSVYAATVSQGRPDRQVSDELYVGLAHFLQIEWADGPSHGHELRDLLEKYLRELGQPRLANSIGPDPFPLSATTIRSREVASAVRCGLIIPLDAACGDRFVGCDVRWSDLAAPLSPFGWCGQFARLVDWEQAAAQSGLSPLALVAAVTQAAGETAITIVLDWNRERAARRTPSPLQSLFEWPCPRDRLRDAIFDAVAENPNRRLQIDAFYDARDIQYDSTLMPAIEAARAGAAICFRPRRRAVNRESDVICSIGVDMGRLVEILTELRRLPPTIEELTRALPLVAALAAACGKARQRRLRMLAGADRNQALRILNGQILVSPLNTTIATLHCSGVRWPPAQTRQVHRALAVELQKLGLDVGESPGRREPGELFVGRPVVELRRLTGFEASRCATSIEFQFGDGPPASHENILSALRWAFHAGDVRRVWFCLNPALRLLRTLDPSKATAESAKY